MSETGTHFLGINSDPLDVRLWGGQITWTENITELSTMCEHGGSHHWLGWSQIYPEFSASCRLLLGTIHCSHTWTIQPPALVQGPEMFCIFCCSIKQPEQTFAWGCSQIHLHWTSRTVHLKYNNCHLSGILGQSPGSQNCPWHELVWHRKSKGNQTSFKGWIWTSDSLEETIMNPLQILAKGDMSASFFPAQGSKLHYFSPRNVVETPQITTSSSCLQWVKSSSNEGAKVRPRRVNVW